MAKYIYNSLANGLASTMVEHLLPNPKVKGLSTTTTAGIRIENGKNVFNSLANGLAQW